MGKLNRKQQRGSGMNCGSTAGLGAAFQRLIKARLRCAGH